MHFTYYRNQERKYTFNHLDFVKYQEVGSMISLPFPLTLMMLVKIPFEIVICIFSLILNASIDMKIIER